MKQKNRKYPDSRTPTSVWTDGEFTVRVFDEEAYQETIRECYTEYVEPAPVAEWDLLDAEIAELFEQERSST